MKCISCGCELPDGAKFCGKCGTKQEKPQEFCMNCGTKLEEGMLFCMNCGTKIGGISNGESSSSDINPPMQKVNNVEPFAEYEEDSRKFGRNLEMIPSKRLFEYWSSLDGKIYCTKNNKMYCYDLDSEKKEELVDLGKVVSGNFALNNRGFFSVDGGSRVSLYNANGIKLGEVNVSGKVVYIYDEFVYTFEMTGNHLSSAILREYSILTGTEREILDGDALEKAYIEYLENCIKMNPDLAWVLETYKEKGNSISEIYVNSRRIYFSLPRWEAAHVVVDRATNKFSFIGYRDNNIWCNLITNSIWRHEGVAGVVESKVDKDGNLKDVVNGISWKDVKNVGYFDGEVAIEYATSKSELSVFNNDGNTICKLYCDYSQSSAIRGIVNIKDRNFEKVSEILSNSNDPYREITGSIKIDC